MRWVLTQLNGRFFIYVDEEYVNPHIPEFPRRGFDTKEKAQTWFAENLPNEELVDET